MRTLIKTQILKNKWLGLLSIITLCFVQFSYKAQECNTLFINNVDISQMKFLKIDCDPNKNYINSIKHIDETIDSMRISIIRGNVFIESFLCNAAGINIPVIDRKNNLYTYVNDLEVLLGIAVDEDWLSITVFKDKKENYFYIPLILNENCE